MKIPELIDKDLLYREIELRIDSIKSKKRVYTVLYRTSKVFTFIAGASITVLTGWKISGGGKADNDNFILVISATIALLAALEGLFNFRDKGRSYDALLFDLRRLRDRICYDFIKGPALYEENKDAHFEEYQKILQAQKSIIENYDGGED
ncbi:SLATT domain-containing protein [Chitinophaga pinensis]|uniref:DUF4231 domain-containing protein n=1 Tax=Chitinophaga pinensis (strain ATCC 43595 / DSM 2588 / LMG 13176 / NBRC 15968 / NCIMB 11800 / UQM 2034) TaxID=485918 RepID=A0A979G585_CHIPD|nr:SLATT domain-containing protein [Chitinophaga pinensis]ACU60991.1 hypothetical protein Cpin_3527 [Chitinophaga pinensis DSM 2588]